MYCNPIVMHKHSYSNWNCKESSKGSTSRYVLLHDIWPSETKHSIHFLGVASIHAFTPAL